MGRGAERGETAGFVAFRASGDTRYVAGLAFRWVGASTRGMSATAKLNLEQPPINRG